MRLGPVMMCALSTDLRRRAAEGDARAIAALIRFFPADLPPAARREYRDGEIRRLANRLCGELPGAGVTAVSEILADAGALLQVPGRALGAHPTFAALDVGERDELEAEVRRLVDLVGGRWPCARQLRNILASAISGHCDFRARGGSVRLDDGEESPR